MKKSKTAYNILKKPYIKEELKFDNSKSKNKKRKHIKKNKK
jgi:hypothetical protein